MSKTRESPKNGSRGVLAVSEKHGIEIVRGLTPTQARNTVEALARDHRESLARYLHALGRAEVGAILAHNAGLARADFGNGFSYSAVGESTLGQDPPLALVHLDARGVPRCQRGYHPGSYVGFLWGPQRPRKTYSLLEIV